jgi:hypothetical protein
MGTTIASDAGEMALLGALDMLLASPATDSTDAVFRQWALSHFDAADVVGWTPEQARVGLRVLEQIQRSIDAVKVALVVRLDAGRDTVAAIKRTTGVSTCHAKELSVVATVIGEHRDAAALLNSGQVSIGHVRSLAKLSPECVAELLPHAANETVDQFRKTVATHRIAIDSQSVSEEQHASRSIKFFTKRNGCIGISIVLPPIEGTEVKNVITEICDQQYRAAHPERAETVGGHNDVEPIERRMADAFMYWTRNRDTKIGKPAFIITIDAETLTATLHPDQPIPLNDAIRVIARSDLYAAIRDGTKTAKLRFGRNTRYASPLQRLALSVLYPTCVYPGCDISAINSDAHHIVEYSNGGLTNIETLAPLCGGHHTHLHLNNQHLQLRHGTFVVTRNPSATQTLAAA